MGQTPSNAEVRHRPPSERQREFIGAALAAREEVARYGLVYDADEVFSYLREKLAGRPVGQPKAVKL